MQGLKSLKDFETRSIYSYILPICQKCIFFISQKRWYSLKGFKGFWPLSNYKHLNNLSKIRFYSYRGFGEFGEFEEFQVFRTPIQLPITKYSVQKCFWLYLMRVWSVSKVWRVWMVRYFCTNTYLFVICSKCFLLYIKRVSRLWSVWRVHSVRDYHPIT